MTVPVAIPPMSPVEALAVAIEVLLLLHVPPDELLVKVVITPVHTVPLPDMVAGSGFTVATAMAEQPSLNV
jgi:hypothetical protein